MTNPKVEQAKAAMSVKVSSLPKDTEKDFLSLSVTLLNLGTYGRTNGGLKKGRIYRIAGSSSSGKTMLCRAILAEAANNKNFDNYDLVYDDVERGAMMNDLKFFGQKFVDRVKAPAYTKDKEPIYSQTIEDFYSRVKQRLDKNKPFVWIEDSMDCLQEIGKENKMSDGKAKYNSQNLRKLVDQIDSTGSILVIVSQAHVNMRSMFGGELAAGGRALEFYPTLDIWLKKSKTLKASYKGKLYPIGIRVRAKIVKNRLTGKDRTVFFPFHEEYGIDDIGANIDFLLQTKHWATVKGIFTAKEFNFEGVRRELIQHIEAKSLQRELQLLVREVWYGIERALQTKREPRYK